MMICVVCAFVSHAYPSQNIVEVRSYSIGQGLSQKMIQNMVQDEDGFIWLATWNGLEKFDGYAFRNFKTYPTDSVRLQYNRIINVAVGPKDGLWCETFDYRLYIFDKGREEFVDPFMLHPGVKPCESIKRSFYLQDGVAWLSARDGSLWRLDGRRYDEAGALKYFPPTRQERGETIYGIYNDGNGGEWVLSNRGYWVYGKSDISGCREFVHAAVVKGGMLLIDSEGKMVLYNAKKGTVTDVLPTLTVRADTEPFALSDGRVMVGLENGVGLYDINRGMVSKVEMAGCDKIARCHEQKLHDRTGSVLWMLTRKDVFRLDLMSMDCERLAKPYNDSSESLDMQFIHEDGNGEMWIYPYNGHLCHYNTHTRSLERASVFTEHGSSPVPDISSYLFDDRKNIWGRAQLGIHKFTFPFGRSAAVFATSGEYRGLFIDSRRNLWAACKEKAVSLYDRNYNYIGNLSVTGEVVRDPGLKFGALVYTVTEDSKGRIWIGAKGEGIYVATPQIDASGRVVRYAMRHYEKKLDELSSLSDSGVYSIFEDRKGRIWIGTYGGGLNLVDEGRDGTMRFIHARNGGLPTYPIVSCEKVRYVTATSAGDIMVCTTGGLVTFDDDFTSPRDIRFHRNRCDITRDSTLSSNDVFYAFEDSRHDIYLATMAGGVCKLKGDNILSDNLRFDYINKQNGLPSDMVYSIREDRDGYLWIALETALCRYNPNNHAIETYDRYDFHIPLVTTEAPFVMDSDGRATLALVNGLLNVDLRSLRKSDYVPKIHFYDAEVNTDDRTVKKIAIRDGVLTLKPDQRNVTMTFTALDYGNTENISYSYRLKGFNDHWIDNGHSNKASFYALPAGNYVLEVRSTNCEGAWNNEVSSIAICVEPTFVETVWAKILYIFAFLAIGLAVWYVSVYILQLQKRINVEQELTRLKLRFFTDVSHELRTPLTLIVNPVDEVLGDASLSATSRDYMMMIKSNTDRMLRLINQFLDIRKIQNGKMRVNLELVDIVPLFHRVYRDFSGLARQKGIKFTLSCPTEQCRIYTDVDKFEKILFNLLSNAFKYTSDGKNVYMGLEADATSVKITVRDEGDGMTENQKSKLFNRFETLGRRVKSPSTGIGLSLVKEIVEILHGTISVDSEVGKGSAFEVVLPGDYESFSKDTAVELILGDGNGVDVAVEHEVPEPVMAEGEDSLCILVVEDNDELRRMLCRMLGDSYNVIEACNGQEALDRMNEVVPDMIISDIMMPRVDGLELLSRVRSDNARCHIPFMLLSAKVSVYERIEGLECGADDYLTKPFSTSYLKARIKSLISQRTRLMDYIVAGHGAVSDSNVERRDTDAELPVLTNFDTEFVNRLSAFIEQQSSRSDLTIDEMASAMSLGRTVFNRKVKSLLNTTPVELLTAMRLKKAESLIKDSDLTMAEISYRCGFSSPQYFNRVFKSRYKCTPLEWRVSLHETVSGSR